MTLSFGDLITLEIAAAFLCHYTERSALLDDQFALACFLPNDKLVCLLISPRPTTARIALVICRYSAMDQMSTPVNDVSHPN